jgi:low affinity Fe/Cu permease
MKQLLVSADVRWSGGALAVELFEFSVAVSTTLLLKVSEAWQIYLGLSIAWENRAVP